MTGSGQPQEEAMLDNMDWQKLFLDWHGRINRQPFWIGMILLSQGP